MTKFKQSRRTFLGSTAAVGTAGLLFPLGSGSVSWADGKKVLKWRAVRDMTILDPGYMVGGVESDIQFALMPTLVDYDRDDGGNLKAIPSGYVSKIEHSDPTHIEFTLIPGLQWSNGFGELTAEDVKFSLERMKNTEWSGYFTLMEGVEVKDRYSGTIVMSAPYAPFWYSGLPNVAMIQCKKALEGLESGQYTTEIPATCGPYLYEWRPTDRVVFTRNPEWTGPEADFDEIHYILIEEDQTAELAFEAGEVDCTVVSTTTYARYLKSPPPNTTLVVPGALNWKWLGMNTEHPKLQDIRVRKAIQYAVDVDAINEGAYSNTAIKSHGIVCPGLAGQRKESKYSYDPEKARVLLKEAGVSGLQLDLKLQNIPEWVLAAQIIQANLQAVGIDVKVIPLDPGPFWDMGQESKGDTWKDLQIWIMRYGTSPDAGEGFQWYLKDQVGVWNWERWTNAEFDELYHEGKTETDPNKRIQIYLRKQEIMEDTGAYVWINHEPEVFAYRDDYHMQITPSGNYEFSRSRASA